MQQQEQLQKSRRQQLRAIGKQLLPTFRKKGSSEERSLVSTVPAPTFRSYVGTPPVLASATTAAAAAGGCVEIMEEKEVISNSVERQQEAGIELDGKVIVDTNNVLEKHNVQISSMTSPDLNDWLLIDRLDTSIDTSAKSLQPPLSPSGSCAQGDGDGLKSIFNPSYIQTVDEKLVDEKLDSTADSTDQESDISDSIMKTNLLREKAVSKRNDGYSFRDTNTSSESSENAEAARYCSILQYDPFEILREKRFTTASDLMKFDGADSDDDDDDDDEYTTPTSDLSSEMSALFVRLSSEGNNTFTSQTSTVSMRGIEADLAATLSTGSAGTFINSATAAADFLGSDAVIKPLGDNFTEPSSNGANQTAPFVDPSAGQTVTAADPFVESGSSAVVARSQATTAVGTGAAADQAMGCPTAVKLCGYLNKHKVGSRLSAGSIGLPVGLPRIFKRRWFVFSDVTCCLLYYRSSQDLLPLGEISVARATFTFEPSSLLEGESGEHRCNIFEIRSGGKKYWLEARDRHTMLYWLQELQLRRRNYRKNRTKSSSSEDVSGQGLISSDANRKANVGNSQEQKATLLLDNVDAPQGTVGQSSAGMDEGCRLALKDLSVTNLKVELRNFVSSMSSNRLSKLSRGSSEDVNEETSGYSVNTALRSASIPETGSNSSEVVAGKRPMSLCVQSSCSVTEARRPSEPSSRTLYSPKSLSKPFTSNLSPMNDKNSRFAEDEGSRQILQEDCQREGASRGRMFSNLTGRMSFRRRFRGNSSAMIRDRESVPEESVRKGSSTCENCHELEDRLEQSREETALMMNEMEAMRDIIATFRVELETLQLQLETQKCLSGSQKIDDYMECIADKDRQIVRLQQALSEESGDQTSEADESANESICELQQRLQEAEEELVMFRESVECKDRILMSLIDRLSQLELSSEDRKLILAPPTDLAIQSSASGACQSNEDVLIGRERVGDSLLIQLDDSDTSSIDQPFLQDLEGELQQQPSQQQQQLSHQQQPNQQQQQQQPSQLQQQQLSHQQQPNQQQQQQPSQLQQQQLSHQQQPNQQQQQPSQLQQQPSQQQQHQQPNQQLQSQQQEPYQPQQPIQQQQSGQQQRSNQQQHQQAIQQQHQQPHSKQQPHQQQQQQLNHQQSKQQQQHVPRRDPSKPRQQQQQHQSFPSQQQQVYSRLVKLISGGVATTSGRGAASGSSATGSTGDGGVEEMERLRDQCRAYKLQNQFLNQEILEIDQLLKYEETRNEQLTRALSESEALYCQVKSKHIYCLRQLAQPVVDENFNQEIVSQLLAEALDSYENNGVSSLRGMASNSALTISSSQYDEYGFDRQQERIDLIGGLDSAAAALAESLQLKYMQYESKARKSDSNVAIAVKFERYLAASGDRPLALSQELKELIRGGVPCNLRHKVWKACIESRVNRIPDYYKKLVGMSTAARVHHQIEIDLLRTLPNNRHYASLQSDGIPQLRNVLLAFAVHNPQIGYCQGLNRLVAIMLLFLDEETTFWGLVTIIECIMPSCYYDHTLIAAHADQRVLKDFVQTKLPQMSSHFAALNFDLSLFTFSWFLTVFIDNIPVETYLRVWDTFLYEGSKVLFRYTVAALKYNEEVIMQQRDLASLHGLMRNIGSTLIDIDRLTKIAFQELNPFPMRLLTHKRSQHLQKLKIELAELETLRKSFEGNIKRYASKEALSDEEN